MMSVELTLLGWTALLGFVQIMIAAGAVSRIKGMEWAAGPRDDSGSPPTGVAGRLKRAQANFFETFPLFAALVLIAHVAGREGTATHWASHLFFWARLVYVPLYALAVPYLRTVAWGVAVLGLAIDLVVVLGG